MGRASTRSSRVPDVEREDIQQALEYVAWVTREEIRVP
jgi:hypothetical protein